MQSERSESYDEQEIQNGGYVPGFDGLCGHSPLAANAEAPEETPDAGVSAATEHAETPEAEAPVEEVPVKEETPEEKEETPEEKKETPEEQAPAENAVVEKEAPVEVAPAPAEADADILTEDPDADIAAEDPDAGIATMDGMENAVSDEHEAKIGDTSYGTLDEALKQAQAKDEVVLQKDHKGNIKITEWIKLNLNGKKIEGNVDVDLSKKQDDETDAEKKVEIVDGTITGATESGVTIKDAGDTNVLLKDLTIEKNKGKQGGGVHIENSQNVTIDHCTIQGNTGTRGGGIYTEHSTVEVKDSTFEKNTATDDGGAIAATQNSSLTVRNSKVLENKAADTAGGILAEKSTLEVTDSIIDGNRASVGGGLYISDIDAPGETKEDKPEHTITRTEITNNTADGQGIGGGIYLGAQKLTITDSKLTGNNTISKNGQTQGGAIVAYSPGDFTLDNTLIQGNTADVGGGIHVLSTKLRDSHIILCNNTRITGNVANQFGGGIFLDNMNNPAVLELVNASVDNNTANIAGGIGNYGSIVVLKDGAVLENNTAKQYGGGLYNRGKVTVESGATVMNNTASTYGGGLYNKGEATVESGAKLYNNHAALAGDDIYLAGKNSTLTLTKVGDDWMLDDCGHKINGWFADLLDARWDADGKQEHVINLKDYAADGLTIVENEDGSYTITILDKNATLALKAAHNVTPKPTPDPDPEPTPDPDTPDTPVSPEDPTTPSVQDATPDDAEMPVNPENPSNPPVQDATPDSTVAALPKTGVNWFTALAMALSGMALTVAGAFTSLFTKSKH